MRSLRFYDKQKRYLMFENIDMQLFAGFATAIATIAIATGVVLFRSKRALMKKIDAIQNDLHEESLRCAAYLQELRMLKEERSALQEERQKNHQERDILLQEAQNAKAQLLAMQKANENLKEHYEEQSRKLELRLNEIMQKNLDKKIEKFDSNSIKALEGILKPFKEKITAFESKVTQSQLDTTKRFAELTKEIETITKASAKLSEEAHSLAEALKGKKQMTGAWGEMILESVLEYSGLLKGVHYEKQISYRDEEGATKRPDVVIKLPGERSIVIDSKVSLVDYDAYIRAEGEEAKTVAAKKLVNDFKNHIETLASKDYTHYNSGTLQYVFMFIPIEGAFATALYYDPSLYEYALKRHIALVTPATLTVSLRTIYLYWQSEKSNEYAQKLFVEAGKLYDKVVLFAQNFEKIGTQLQTVQKSYEQAYGQLASGGGNVLKRISNLKSLGAKTTKNLQ